MLELLDRKGITALKIKGESIDRKHCHIVGIFIKIFTAHVDNLKVLFCGKKYIRLLAQGRNMHWLPVKNIVVVNHGGIGFTQSLV